MFAILSDNFYSAFTAEIIGAFCMGGLAILMLLAAFKLFDKLTPKLDIEHALSQSPMAAATVISSLFLAVAVVMAVVFMGR